jgi:thiol-disulfide isomerase/thioredoxin
VSPTTTVVATSTVAEPAIAQYRPVRVFGPPLPEGAKSSPDPAIGQPAPSLAGQSFDGTPVVAPAGEGRPTLLVFGSHWCPHCRAELASLQAWVDAGGKPDGLDLVAVSTAADERGPGYPPSDLFRALRWSSPVMADDQAATAARTYGLEFFPMLVAVGGDGLVKGRVVGRLTDEQLASFLAVTLGAG